MPKASTPPTQPHPAWVGFFDEIMRLDGELTARRAIRQKRGQDLRRLAAMTPLPAFASLLVLTISLGRADSREVSLRNCLVGSPPRFTKSDHFVIKSDRTICLKQTG